MHLVAGGRIAGFNDIIFEAKAAERGSRYRR